MIILVWNAASAFLASGFPALFPPQYLFTGVSNIFGVLWLMYNLSMALGYSVSLFMDYPAAIVCGAVLFNFSYIFTGSSPPIPSLPEQSGSAILYHFSLFRWALESYYISAVDGLEGASLGLSKYGFDPNNFSINCLVLFLFWVAALIFVYYFLKLRAHFYTKSPLPHECVTYNITAGNNPPPPPNNFQVNEDEENFYSAEEAHPNPEEVE